MARKKETMEELEMVKGMEQAVAEAKAMEPAEKEEMIYELADLFKVFGDSTRLKVMMCLFDKEACVNDIAEELDMTQSAISHQLRILKQNKLVKCRRDGKTMIYALADEHVHTIIAMGEEHVEEDL